MENGAALALPADPSPALVHNRYVESRLSGAANTAKAYTGDLKRLRVWCAKHELDPLQAMVATLASSLHLAEPGKQVSTILCHCAVVFEAHALRSVNSRLTSVIDSGV
jgi:site-specific recombinase XerD